MAAFSTWFPHPTVIHFISLLFAVLLLYYLGLPASLKIIKLFQKRRRKTNPRIGILNGNIESPVREYKCQHGFTDVTAAMWFTTLKRELKKAKLEMTTTSMISDRFSIIINPFGDIFPEEDQKLHTTFYRICEFIKNGGFFVCTGGAFWAHQNTKISENHEWVFIRIQQTGMQSLKDSFLYKDLVLCQPAMYGKTKK